ncbi:hypothetical protein I5I01_gp86 [Mycobacterium phage MooMoo]|uniref:Uncharacterized protein n=1 Tax=Mycobacterium phage MooMoo TaxID=2108127 RepID=A0A2P1JRE2_9CAUD|nr:hypothetical protein I5I01_gp86 [Mycobacterium phage MooMoo]AVO21691.1 hypothetical protein SEA_MOOMOO_86 [Mycobacterium phage MooMoo]
MNAYDDLGGSRELPASYDQCGHRVCPTCHAQPGEVCTFKVQTPTPSGVQMVTRPRHLPCITRTKTPEFEYPAENGDNE